MRWRLFLILTFTAGPALAASSIEQLCPGAARILSSISFPTNVAANADKVTAEVDLTVRTDGSVSDATIHSSSDPSLEKPVLQAVSKLSCAPQASERRFRLPVHLMRPREMTSETCPNYNSVIARNIGFPKAAYTKGFTSGEVLLEFEMEPDGEILEFYVISSTDETFTSMALHGLARLKCTGLGYKHRVRVPFKFLLDPPL